ncbi:MAG: dipeptide epimerase [Methanothrix sp.]|nr:MAG: dipeptide epimerase [Methanothrix sp.]
MKPQITWQKITLKLRTPFRLSYGTSEERLAYWIRLKNDEGWGEGTIPPYYGVSTDAMEAFWKIASERTEPFPDDPEKISSWVGLDGPAPARCALDIALHDRIARANNMPLYKLLGIPKPEPKLSSFTIAIDTPSEMAKRALQASQYSIIKVKLGSDDLDMDRLQAIREVRPDILLRLDANAGWTMDNALGYIRDLERFDLEMIEQPLSKDDIKGMGVIQAQTHIPIVADESVQTIKNIEDLASAGVKGVNIKLMKVGGLSPALQMIKRSRELGLKIMLGCMVETSIGTTAMAHLGSLAEWLDLDASALILNDPFEGMIYDGSGIVKIPDRVGIGVVLKNK